MNRSLIEKLVIQALAEDIGSGDVTAALIPEDCQATAQVVAREACVVCGQLLVDAVFADIDANIQIHWHVQEGERITADTLLCDLSGNARALLTAERTALNFLQTLSGTATVVNQYVNEIAGTTTRILDTRKTIPGLRDAQKYAVRCGGGHNHRMGLFDGILIKENHIEAARSITKAIAAAQALNTALAIEVEVETLDELIQAIDAGADIVMLDNMSIVELEQAVVLNQGRVKLEASGNISLANVRQVALTGVDFISIGGLTKHVQAIDLSMRFN